MHQSSSLLVGVIVVSNSLTNLSTLLFLGPGEFMLNWESCLKCVQRNHRVRFWGKLKGINIFLFTLHLLVYFFRPCLPSFLRLIRRVSYWYIMMFLAYTLLSFYFLRRNLHSFHPTFYWFSWSIYLSWCSFQTVLCLSIKNSFWWSLIPDTVSSILIKFCIFQ